MLGVFSYTFTGWEFVFLSVLTLALAWRFIRLRQRLRRSDTFLSHLKEEKRVLFDFVHDIGEALTDEMNQKQLLDTILKCTAEVTTAQSGIIYLKHPSNNKLVARSVLGLFPPPVPLSPEIEKQVASLDKSLQSILFSQPIHLSDSPRNVFAQVFLTGKPVWIANALDDVRYPDANIETLQLHSLIAMPLKYRDEVYGVIALANHAHRTNFTRSDFEIAKSVATQASFSMHHAAVYQQLTEKHKLDHDIQTAYQIQRILLPSSHPDIPNYDLAAFNRPAQYVSGDYYDFFPIDPKNWGIVIADVSGKGIPASLIMATCRAVVRQFAQRERSPSAVLRKVNRTLQNEIRRDMFITMVYAVLNTKKDTLTFARAGHPAPFLLKANKEVETLSAPGLALGIDRGSIFDKITQDSVVPIRPGETFMAFTDGANEAVDVHGEEFGRERIRSGLAHSKTGDAQTVINQIADDISQFTVGATQQDDITLVALQNLKGL